MTLVRLFVDPDREDYQKAVNLLILTIEKLNQKQVVLDRAQKQLIIESVEKFNRGEYLIPDLEVEFNSLFEGFHLTDSQDNNKAEKKERGPYGTRDRKTL